MSNKRSNRAIDFDVAHALVDYVWRSGETIELDGKKGRTTLRAIKTQLCKLKREDGTICVPTLNEWLSQHEDTRMYGRPPGFGSIAHLKQLIRRAAFHYKKTDPYRMRVESSQRDLTCKLNRLRKDQAKQQDDFDYSFLVRNSEDNGAEPDTYEWTAQQGVAKWSQDSLSEMDFQDFRLPRTVDPAWDYWDDGYKQSTYARQDAEKAAIKAIEDDWLALSRWQKFKLWVQMRWDMYKGEY